LVPRVLLIETTGRRPCTTGTLRPSERAAIQLIRLRLTPQHTEDDGLPAIARGPEMEQVGEKAL
jgi:hypothetical protein